MGAWHGALTNWARKFRMKRVESWNLRLMMAQKNILAIMSISWSSAANSASSGEKPKPLGDMRGTEMSSEESGRAGDRLGRGAGGAAGLAPAS